MIVQCCIVISQDWTTNFVVTIKRLEDFEVNLQKYKDCNNKKNFISL